MKDQGTRILIYNLWKDDQGQLELDFDAVKHDIQIRGVIKMAQQFPNSRHYLTYRHSLRIYASILYLRVPYRFRMILRGRDVQHHNVINEVPKDSDMVALVTMGFVKDAKAHIDVQGFNVYHINRLIKKPLFYADTIHAVTFASRLKSIKPSLVAKKQTSSNVPLSAN